ncbi:MAG: hypothetical protein ABTQ34_00360 [Bdellovibrionales bacterium]
MMSALLKDPMFFYSIAFVLFFVVMYVKVRKPALGWIDGEILKIRQELDEAKRLRTEAEVALIATRDKQQAAMARSEEIVRQAKEDAEHMKQKATDELSEILARQERLAVERIKLAEHEAEAEIRAVAVDLALTIAREALARNISGALSAQLVDHAISEVGSKKLVG